MWLKNMNTQTQSNRERIIEVAYQLFYTKGYNQTSFADVANELGISKGNLHYHFPSKGALLNTVIALRKQQIIEMFAQWDGEFSDAKDRLKRFIQMMINNEANLVRYGCPLGSLNVELGKDQRDLQGMSREMFDLYQHWLEKVFTQLDSKKSKARSLHLLSMTQGTAMMTYIYSDSKLLKDECNAINEWIDSL